MPRPQTSLPVMPTGCLVRPPSSNSGSSGVPPGKTTWPLVTASWPPHPYRRHPQGDEGEVVEHHPTDFCEGRWESTGGGQQCRARQPARSRPVVGRDGLLERNIDARWTTPETTSWRIPTLALRPTEERGVNAVLECVEKTPSPWNYLAGQPSLCRPGQSVEFGSAPIRVGLSDVPPSTRSKRWDRYVLGYLTDVSPGTSCVRHSRLEQFGGVVHHDRHIRPLFGPDRLPGWGAPASSPSLH